MLLHTSILILLIFLLLYQSIIQHTLLYCSTCFHNMLSVENKTKLTCITNTTVNIIGLPTPTETQHVQLLLLTMIITLHSVEKYDKQLIWFNNNFNNEII